MKLRSPLPYWLMRDGMLAEYPSLNGDLRCDVVVLGGGVTGALVSHRLSEAGIDHAVIEKGHIGMGSTCASTALLQYEIDAPLYKLVKKMPEQDAADCYRLCREAIEGLEVIAGKTGGASEFRLTQSLQYASYQSHVEPLRKEYGLRKKHNIAPMEWLGPADIEAMYGFSKPGAVLSHCGATMNPYRFTHALLQRSAQVYQNTEVLRIEHGKAHITLHTSSYKIRCRQLVIACGYESQRYLPLQVEIPNSTFAIVSEPVDTDADFWHNNSLIWETADPYLYLRSTRDKRIIIGGKDVPVTRDYDRDKLLPKKIKQLEASFSKLFPEIRFKTDFAWAGFFCKTKDGLPYIGAVKELPCTYFALGFGGNGITFSYTAAEIIRDLLLGRPNAQARLFSFYR